MARGTRGNIPAWTAISLRISSISPYSGLARAVKRKVNRPTTIAHRLPSQTQEREEAGFLDKLLEFTLAEYQKRIDKLKELKPDTAGYENLIQDIDKLQEQLDQLRKQIFEKRE